MYILILLLFYNRAGLAVEFTSKDKCEAAGREIASKDTLVKYYCVEK
jgi:hypothetical protein